MTDETNKPISEQRRKEAIERRELIRAIPKGPKKRVVKRMNQLIAAIDHITDEHSPK